MNQRSTFRAIPPSHKIVSGWDKVSRSLADPRLLAWSTETDAAAQQRYNLLAMDGPDHLAVRRLVSAHFSPEKLTSTSSRLASLAAKLARRLNRKATASDLIGELVEPLVLDGIFSLVDVPVPYRRRVRSALRDMVGFLEPDAPDQLRVTARRAALGATLLLSRAWNNDGLQARLSQAVSKGQISLQLARTTPLVVLHGGYENPLNMLGCAVHWASSNARLLQATPPERLEALFNELVRLYSPVKAVVRRAASGMPDHGGLSEGELLWISLQSANEDSGRFQPQDRPETERALAGLGFGHGTHKCLGIALARIEGVVLLRALRSLAPERLARTHTSWREGFVGRGLAHAAMP